MLHVFISSHSYQYVLKICMLVIIVLENLLTKEMIQTLI
jgi:hypothetical protein